MYIPPNAQKLSDIEVPQIRLALQGASGTGKTYSSLTFPNVIVANFDNNLTAHKHRSDVHSINFNSSEWLKENFKGIGEYTNALTKKYPARDCFKEWLKLEGPKLEANQTLLIDSWSTLQDAFDMQTDLEPVRTTSGGVDAFAFWALKIDYSQEIMTIMKSLKCHVVVTFHEQDTKDANGNAIGKTEPMMQGKFQKKLGLYFTDFFRCVTKSKMAADNKTVIGCEYQWQTKSNSEVNLKSRLDLPMFIPPTFDSLKAYFSTNPS